MGEFSEKEIQITNYIVDRINSEIFSAEQDEIDKRRLEYSLCSNQKERLEVTKKRVAKYKSKIDKCDPDIAAYLAELVRHNPEQIDDGELRDSLTKDFVMYHYQELIEELAPFGEKEIEDYVFSSIVKSRGHSYKKIRKYIEGVFNIIQYTNHKSYLDTKIEYNQDTVENKNYTVKTEKVKITYLDDVFIKNKDILPQSIINAYNKIGEFRSLLITEIEDQTIKNIYLNDEPFENIEGKVLIRYYCIKSNYLNLVSKIEDSSFVFFDNRPIDLYLYEYAKAFVLAYSEFETILNQNQTLIADTQEQKALKIFLYVLNAKYKNGYFGGDYEEIEELKNKKGMYVSDDEMYEWGYKGGQFYKAWEIILNNPLIFEPLFYKYKDAFDIDKTPITNEDSANNHLKSTIEDYLEEFEDEINQNGYEILVNALYDYFSIGTFPVLTSKINFKKINKKRLGWALKELHKCVKIDTISFDYLLFAKLNINLFTNETLEEHNFRKSNLYKNFTTNPAKQGNHLNH